jgi:hypothetical protein
MPARVLIPGDAVKSVRFGRVRARARQQRRHAGHDGDTLELEPTDAHLDMVSARLLSRRREAQRGACEP